MPNSAGKKKLNEASKETDTAQEGMRNAKLICANQSRYKAQNKWRQTEHRQYVPTFRHSGAFPALLARELSIESKYLAITGEAQFEGELQTQT